MKNSLSIEILAALLLLTAACSTHPTEKEVASPSSKNPTAQTISIETQQVAAEQNTDFVTEISFRKKDVALSKDNATKIQNLIDRAARFGSIQEVKVITWADTEYPSINTKKLSSAEREIAEHRNEAIEDYIESKHKDMKVKTYSMAERAGALKEFVGSSEARIKKSLEVAGIPTTDTTVKYPSKASKSIVMVVLE